MITEVQRREILISFGAGKQEADELIAYNKNHFVQSRDQINSLPSFPLPDELFISAWQAYEREAESTNVIDVLRKKLIQLRFPIVEGISQTEAYRSATLKGVLPESTSHISGDSSHSPNGIEIHQPESLELMIYQTAAGKIPIITTRHRPDFVRLVQALTRRNEPVSIPDSMGACMVSGYNNWDRIREYRLNWEQTSGGKIDEQSWSTQFRLLIQQKELYQDRFILLTDGPYSAVSAEHTGMSAKDWNEESLIIRREHECAHYFTRRVFSSMQNHMVDELIADYVGIVAAHGSYRADWFLRFIGLEQYPLYREGGRLQNYRGQPPLSDSSMQILQTLLFQAAHHLEQFERNDPHPCSWHERIIALCCMSLEEMAIGDFTKGKFEE